PPMAAPRHPRPAEPRRRRTAGVHDALRARVPDVAAGVPARRSATEIDVVFAVRDPFLASGGRYRLRGGPDGAECVPAQAGAPVVGIEVAALGSLLFGGAHAGSLARAGLLGSDDPAAVPRVDTAFRAERTPRHGTEF